MLARLKRTLRSSALDPRLRALAERCLSGRGALSLWCSPLAFQAGPNAGLGKEIALDGARCAFARRRCGSRLRQGFHLAFVLALAVEYAAPLEAHQRVFERVDLRFLPVNLASNLRCFGKAGNAAPRRAPKRPTADAEVFDNGLERQIVLELHRYGLS